MKYVNTTRRMQPGFTLVELLIAMILGLALMAGVIQIFLSTQNTYRMQEGLARIQDNGRFSLDLISSQLKMAGYPAADATLVPYAWDTDSVGTDYNHTALITNPTGNVDTDANGNDVLEFQYQSVPTAGSTTRDCIGNIIAINNLVQNRYFVDAAQTLSCTSSFGGGTTQPLVANVESFQVQYGVDTTGDGVPEQWLNAGAVPATAWQNQIVAVRIALLIASGNTIADSLDSQTYTLLDAPVTVAANDLQRRRVFTTTVAVRNRSL